MDVSEIKDSESFQAWLEDKPKEWAQALAARIALRTAPLAWFVATLSEDVLEKKHRENLTLLTFRANFISSVARNYPTDDMKSAANAAARAANAAFAAARAAAFADASYAAARAAAFADASYAANAANAAYAAYAANAAYAAANAAARAANAAARAAANAANASDVAARAAAYADVWESIRTDCEWLSKHSQDEALTAAAHAQALVSQPLWMKLASPDTLPDWAKTKFHEFTTCDLAQTTSFGLITDWYRSILQGKPSPFGKKAELAIAQMSPKDWGDHDDERDCVAVMDRVAEIAGWVRGSDQLSMPEFILKMFKENPNKALSIDDFVKLFEEAGYTSTRDSIRGRLVDLADAKEIFRWEPGVYSLIRKEDAQLTPELPDETAFDARNQNGTSVSSFKDGPLKPIQDPPELQADDEQQALYDELRNQLKDIKADTPSQDLMECSKLIDSFLDQPLKLFDIRHSKVFWLRGNSLRSRLARHDAVSDQDYHFDKLPPSLAESLRLPIEAWNVLVSGDQKLRSIDTLRRGPLDHKKLKNEAAAAKPVLEAAINDNSIITDELAKVVKPQMELAEQVDENIHGDQTLIVANATSRNVSGELLSGAYHTVLKVYRQLPLEGKIAGGSVVSGAGAAMGADLWNSIKSSWVFVEFIAANPEIIKHYLSSVYGNPALERAVDFIKQIKECYMPEE